MYATADAAAVTPDQLARRRHVASPPNRPPWPYNADIVQRFRADPSTITVTQPIRTSDFIKGGFTIDDWIKQCEKSHNILSL